MSRTPLALILAFTAPILCRARQTNAAPAPYPRLAEIALAAAPSGAEHARLERIAALVAAMSAAGAPAPAARYDSLGNLIYTFGGSDRPWLIVTEVDEPGYLVSAVTSDGYVRLQQARDRLPVPADATLLFAHPLIIERARGAITGIGAGLSIHLQPSREPGTAPAYHLDNLFVDLGADSAAAVEGAGIEVLDPVTIEHQVYRAPGSTAWVGTALSSVAAVPAVAALAERLGRLKRPPAVVVAFATQGYFDHDGLQRLLTELRPAATVLVRGAAGPGWSVAGSDATLASEWQSVSGAMTAKQLPAALARIANADDAGAPLLEVNFPIGHLHSDAEILNGGDIARLANWLPAFVARATGRPAVAHEAAPAPAPPTRLAGVRARVGGPTGSGVIDLLRQLVETTGVSAHEAPVRALIQRRIARETPAGAEVQVDGAGNLTVAWGPAGAAKSLLFIAHMDEIGWQVENFLPDGQLALRWEGSGLDAFYGNHVALVHTAKGLAIPGALTFAAFDGKSGVGGRGQPRLDLGMSEAAARALGVEPGDAVAIPKKYRPLLGTRASARSFDDRVGCAALVAALGALRDYQPRDRRVIFAWSTGEELGLLGATALAAWLHPSAVFALDTFVSSDSPLENHRFADAPLGHGFVIRAVDNGLLTPRRLVARVRAIAAGQGIPMQFGATGGSTDAVPFLRWGSEAMALGWPLRYSHSPGEVIDTRDVEALAAIVPALAREW